MGHGETLGNTFCGVFLFFFLSIQASHPCGMASVGGAHQQLNGLGITQVLFQAYNSDMEGLQRN